METLPQNNYIVTFQLAVVRRLGGYVVQINELGCKPLNEFSNCITKMIDFDKAYKVWLWSLRRILEGGYYKMQYAHPNFGSNELKPEECIAILTYHETKKPLMQVVREIVG